MAQHNSQSQYPTIFCFSPPFFLHNRFSSKQQHPITANRNRGENHSIPLSRPSIIHSTSHSHHTKNKILKIRPYLDTQSSKTPPPLQISTNIKPKIKPPKNQYNDTLPHFRPPSKGPTITNPSLTQHHTTQSKISQQQ